MKHLALLLSALLAACTTHATTPAVGTDCVAACEQMRKLSCPAGDPSPAGAACEVWRCTVPDVTSRSSCVARSTSCEEAAACP